jgi:hypothetical protein
MAQNRKSLTKIATGGIALPKLIDILKVGEHGQLRRKRLV